MIFTSSILATGIYTYIYTLITEILTWFRYIEVIHIILINPGYTSDKLGNEDTVVDLSKLFNFCEVVAILVVYLL